MTATELADELERLGKEATNPPWVVVSREEGFGYGLMYQHDQRHALTIDDLRLAADLRNNLPAIVHALRERDEARAALLGIDLLILADDARFAFAADTGSRVCRQDSAVETTPRRGDRSALAGRSIKYGFWLKMLLLALVITLCLLMPFLAAGGE